MDKKTKYQTPAMHDLGVMEAIGACNSGATVSSCNPGASYGQDVCVAGSIVLPLDCLAGTAAWRK